MLLQCSHKKHFYSVLILFIISGCGCGRATARTKSKDVTPCMWTGSPVSSVSVKLNIISNPFCDSTHCERLVFYFQKKKKGSF